MDEQGEALARVTRLMRELEALLLEIKEATIPAIVGGAASGAARARHILRLADRMLEILHEHHIGDSRPTA